MAATQAAGNGHRVPAHARVRDDGDAYVIRLDVADFVESELSVEALGRQVAVKGDRRETIDDLGNAFRLHEQLQESFRLPDDAAADRITVVYEHGTLEIRAPRTPLEPRTLPIEHASSAINPDVVPC